MGKGIEKDLPPEKVQEKEQTDKSEKKADKKEIELEFDSDTLPAGFDEEEDFEWEKEFKVVENKLSEWDDSDEEDIIGIDGSDIQEDNEGKC